MYMEDISEEYIIIIVTHIRLYFERKNDACLHLQKIMYIQRAISVMQKINK